MTKTINLNGKWRYIIDQNDSYSYEEILSKLGSISDEMTVPSNWQLQGLDNYSGSVWFIKYFNCTDSEENIKILEFLGIDYFADVWLNGQYLGNHEGYFQKIVFDVSDIIVSEDNILIVKVNSPYEKPGDVWPLKKQAIKGVLNHHDCRPGAWNYEKGQDKNTGGIWNNVNLYCGYPVYLEQVKITSKVSVKNRTAEVDIKIKHINNIKIAKNIKAQLEITDPAGKVQKLFITLKKSKGANISECSITLKDVYLWQTFDTGTPYLYQINISSEYFQEYNCAYGFKKVKLDKDNVFYLNNKRLFLKGTNLIAEQLLSSLTLDRIEKIVKMMKEANINAVRVHAHINRDELYSEFDKQGILVWQDFALQWTYEESDKFYKNAVRQIKDMVNQLYNHTSIAFWCCHNEPGIQIESLDKELEKAVKKEDSQRIIRRASNYEEHAYDGWYWGITEHYIAAPMGPLVTEFGAQALPAVESLEKMVGKDNIFPPQLEVWEYHDFQPDQTFNIAKVKIGNNIGEFISNSQRYQSELLKASIHYYRRKKYNGITGLFQFMFVDCWPSITWSVVDYYLVPKAGYYTLKDAFSPVLLSLKVRQDQYFTGTKLNIDIWVINDTYAQISDYKIEFEVDGKVFNIVNGISAKADDMFFVPFDKINIDLPMDLAEGSHGISAILRDTEGNIVSSYNFEISLLKKDVSRIK
jgi:beta-mannosidase